MEKRNTSYSRLNNIPEWIYREAECRAARQKVFDNSHRKDEANQIGCLGEVIAEYWMKARSIEFESQLNCTTHDYLVNGKTIDVKTKDRTVPPKSDFDNTAPCYNHGYQKPDYFLFISLERERPKKKGNIRRFHTAYVVGGIGYAELDKVGLRFLAKEKDWRNGTPFWTDCLNVEMWQLIPNREICQILKGELLAPTKDAALNVPVIENMKQLIEEGKYKERSLPIC